MPAVKVYLTRWCPFCVSAERLLESKGIQFERVDVAGDHETRAWLREATGQHTVPQIFIHGQPIGGFEELSALDRMGRLDALLEPET
jgi:glutaredoxin 3